MKKLSFVGIAAGTLALGLFAMPAVAGAATASTTISSAIGSVISTFSSNGTVNVNVTPSAAGAQTIASDTLTVSTNNSLGYTLLINDTNATTTLSSGANNINAIGGTQAVPIALTANTWGYRVDTVGGFGAGPTSGTNSTAIGTVKFAAMPINTLPNTIKTTATTAANDTTTVWYSVAANTSQASGTYTDGVTYTATAN
jgi:hypothetical protein